MTTETINRQSLADWLKHYFKGESAALPQLLENAWPNTPSPADGSNGLPLSALNALLETAPDASVFLAPNESSTGSDASASSSAEAAPPDSQHQDRRAPTSSTTTASLHRMPLSIGELQNRVDGYGAYQPINPGYLDGITQNILNAGQWLRLHGQLDEHLAANIEDFGGFLGHVNISTASAACSIVYKDAGSQSASSSPQCGSTATPGSLKEGLSTLSW